MLFQKCSNETRQKSLLGGDVVYCMHLGEVLIAEDEIFTLKCHFELAGLGESHRSLILAPRKLNSRLLEYNSFRWWSTLKNDCINKAPLFLTDLHLICIQSHTYLLF